MRMKLIAAAIGLALTVTACSDAPVAPQSTQDEQTAIQLSADNPFYAPSPLQFQAPDFTRIRDEHYAPAFEAGKAQQAE